MSIQTEKKLWRQKINEQKSALSSREKQDKSQSICTLLENSTLFSTLFSTKEAQVIGVFYPFSDEPQIQPFLEKLSQTHHRLAFPFFNSLSTEPKFYLPESRSEWQKQPLVPNLIDPALIDLIFLPGVAFSATGQRLGRGRGFYDRALKKMSLTAKKIGVCFACQIVPNLLTEPHDQSVDTIFSEAKFDNLGNKMSRDHLA